MIHVSVRAKPDREKLQLYYVDPLTGRDVTRSANTSVWKEAERAAAKWEAELEQQGASTPTALSWEQFRQYYEDTHLASKSPKTQVASCSSMNWLERAIGKPKLLQLIDSIVIAKMVSVWRRDGMKDSTIAAHLGHLRAAFGWATRVRLIKERPVFPMPKLGGQLMRGRPLTIKEFRVMLRCSRSICGDVWRDYVRFMRGLWYSGLRLDEAIKLSWDQPPLRIDLDGGKYPRMIIHAPGQKSRRDEIAPLPPDFATWLTRTPRHERTGPVFPIYSNRRRKYRVTSPKRIGRLISEIGRAAEILVNEREQKYASAHDLRRSFGTRWAAKVKPLTLKRLMRHKAIETTLRFYIDQDADDVAEELWAGDLYPRLYPEPSHD